MNKLTKAEFLCRYLSKFNIPYTDALPDNFYGRSIIPVLCKMHGNSYRSAIDILSAKFACKQCGEDSRALNNKENNIGNKLSLDTHIAQFNIVHHNRYTYPTQSFKNSHSKIVVLCKDHGEFSIHIHSHRAGVGCPICKFQTTALYARSLLTREDRILPTIMSNKRRALLPEDALKLFRKQHGERFVYDWAVYTGKSGKINVICEKHGVSTQIVDEHIKSRHGCPLCANYCVSLAEQEWLRNFTITETQKKVSIDKSFVKVDGFDCNTNTIYEYLGNYWHGHPSVHMKSHGVNMRNKITFTDLYKQTEYRLTQLYNLGYNIVYAWEFDCIARTFKGKLES